MNTRFLLKRRRNRNEMSADGNTAKKCKVVLETMQATVRSIDGGGSKAEPLKRRDPTRKGKGNLFNRSELRKVLLPTLETIDARKLSKTSRIHLTTIKNKLSHGKYSDARECVEDVWSMFENKCHSNSNSDTTELARAFELEVNPVMEALGYCCGKNYRFDPQELCCALKAECTISKDAHYFTHQTRNNVCENCFNDTPGDTVTIDGDRIRKDQFERVQNNVTTPEPFIDCQECGRRQHNICVSYSEKIWPAGFVCERCLTSKGAKRTENHFTSKNLPMTKLDCHIEARVNNFLKKNKVDGSRVVVRVLLNTDETVTVKPAMRNLYVESDELQDAFPYRSKAIFAFQEIDGVDVCFFGFFVQEYGSECPFPNTRRVYITFLDSVNFFQPRNYRTAVYHEILLGYIDFVKQLGYTWLHIWSSPPLFGENYIFFKHPTDHKIPDSSRLLGWYTSFLQKGKSEDIIVDFTNILQQSQRDKVSTAATLPYFDGDYWPDFFEEAIQKMNDKSRSVKSRSKPNRKFKGRTKKQSDRFNQMRIIRQKIVLSSRLMSTMAKVKKEFFSVRLHSDEAAVTLGPIRDPDSTCISTIMNSHNAFFEFARDNNHEFSSLRRAKFSTMCILYELHNQETNVDYVCNICKSEMENWYHCRICEDYDLCPDCNEKNGHAHEMYRMESSLIAAVPTVNALASDKQTLRNAIIEINSDTSDDEAPPDLPINLKCPEQTDPLIDELFELFAHASQCSEVNCEMQMCLIMKTCTRHVKLCQKINGACRICKSLNTLLSSHSKSCRNANCSFSFCRDLKAHIQQQQQQQKEKRHNDQMLNIVASLQKMSSNILDNRDKTDPQVILQIAYEMSCIQMQFQEWIAAYNVDLAAKIRKFENTDSVAEDPCTSAQAQN